ncbi:hypothetical protein Ancab_020686 [Ancistrocladus abbreviatus]
MVNSSHSSSLNSLPFPLLSFHAHPPCFSDNTLLSPILSPHIICFFLSRSLVSSIRIFKYNLLKNMSSRRSRSRQSSGVSGISDDQIADLVAKLQQLIPELRGRRSSDKVSASKVLQETCNYIRNMHKEVDDLSERLSQLLASTESDSAQAAIIRSLLM